MAGRTFKANDFDIRLGQIIATQRMRMGMSQKDLARILGVTFQQIQKYETAGNRITAGALYKIATAFEMTVGQLVDGATSQYMTDPVIANTLNIMCTKMNTAQRKCLNQVATYMTGNR